MYRNRNNENLMDELEGRETGLATTNMRQNYKNFYKTQISSIKKELARRWRALAVARNEPRRRVRAAKVIQTRFKKMYYSPVNERGGARGRGYRRAVARVRGQTRTASPRRRVTNTLRAKLENLRAARNSGNRGNMVNIYNGMGRAWTAGGGIHGASVMNNAQRIMSRSGLI